MPLNAGLQAQAAQGRRVQQGPVNYAGRGGVAPARAATQATTDTPQMAAGRPAMGARPIPGPAPTRPAPPRQMSQVADVGFNRAAPPRAPVNHPAPVTGPKPGGYRPPPGHQDMSKLWDYAGSATQPRATQPPAYSGMMGQQQAGLQQSLMQPKQLDPGAGLAPQDAGRERADQSLMGPKTQNLGDTLAQWYRDWDQQQRDNNAGDSNEQATQSGSAATDDPVSTNPQRDAEQERYGVRRDGSGGRDPEQNIRQGTPVALAGDLFNTEGDNPLIGALGDMLSQLSGQMSREDMANLERYFGESLGGYRDIMAGAKGMMDPAQRNAWEDAARGDLQATVNQDKMANLRMNAAAQGRGGAMSSNADTGIYGTAANALATGERGLAQDRYGRDVAGMQAGMAGLGAGAGALQDLLGEGFTSNKETLAYLLTGMEKGADIGQLLADMLGGKWA